MPTIRYPPIRTIHTRVYGVTYSNPDGTDRQQLIQQCQAGDALELVREPDNPHDASAVAVYTAEGQQIGYVAGHRARAVAREMDKGRKLTAVIAKVTGGGWLRKRYGVNMEITIG